MPPNDNFMHLILPELDYMYWEDFYFVVAHIVCKDICPLHVQPFHARKDVPLKSPGIHIVHKDIHSSTALLWIVKISFHECTVTLCFFTSYFVLNL